MSTIIPPPTKKQRKQLQEFNTGALLTKETQAVTNVTISFKSGDTDEVVGGSIRVPLNISSKQLGQLLNQLQKNEDEVPYEFAVADDKGGVDITGTLAQAVLEPGLRTTEDHMTVVYTPQAVFKVKPVTRSSFAIAGHGATILAAKFSPVLSSRMVSGSGDLTAKIWDCDTHTPFRTLSGHSNWVLTVEYSPDGKYIATGSMDDTVKIWHADTGELYGTLAGHSKWITSIGWKPLHLVTGDALMLATGSKDGTVKIWNVSTRACVATLSGHKLSVSCVKWGGFNQIYSTSHDKTIMVWDPETLQSTKTLKSHAHWINHCSLSTDYLIRKGPYDHNETENKRIAKLPLAEKVQLARKKFTVTEERMVTGSDDFTMFLWSPLKQNKPVARMHGHQKLVNHVAFSPDGRHIVSASFDNSIKLWDGVSGTFVSTFRGHVGPVYQVCWSSDNRLLVSGSKDTTLKVWDVKTRKLSCDLPGHKDEVYTIDWSVDGKRVVSGGKDRMIRIWSH